MKIHWTFVASAIMGVALMAAAEEIAIVKGTRVNVRGKATLNSDVVTQVKKGESVTILEEVPDTTAKNGKPGNWAKIVLPANTPVWVNATFIKDGIVAATKLNVRAGPGESFSAVVRLEKGAPVKSLRIVDGWMEIEAPKGATAYVSMDQLARQETKPEAVASDTPGSKPAPAATSTVPPPAPETVKVEPAPAPVAAKDETKVAAATPAPAPAKAAETKPVPDPAPMPLTGAEAKPAAAPQPEEKKGFWSWLTGRGKKSAPAPANDEKPKTEATKATPPADTEPAPKRVVTREGVVRRSLNIQAPTDYYLEDPETGRNMNYLFTTVTNMPWKALKGRTVVVTGEEGLDSRWPKTPVLKIETLKTTP